MAFNKEARERYLAFAGSPAAEWHGNFRDLAASVTRMATFSPKGRIDVETVSKEIERLRSLWSGDISHDDGLSGLLSAQTLAEIDPFDRAQLAFVISICRESRSLSETGRKLFTASRERRASTNDADRLRKYLARFELSWDELHCN